MDDNSIRIAGVLTELPVLSHESHGQSFYTIMVGTNRLSGSTDFLRVQVPKSVLDTITPTLGQPIAVKGHMRSYNNKSGVGNRLLLSVLARELSTEPQEHTNALLLSGTICRAPIYRKTPLGREICDLLLAVTRYHGRSDYLPCITWGATARTCATRKVGDKLAFKGRLQSRQYTKVELEGEMVKIAYEISVSEILPQP